MAQDVLSPVISLPGRDARLKRRIRRHLTSLGFTRTENGDLRSPGSTKPIIREMHAPQRKQIVANQSGFIGVQLPRLHKFFASGRDVQVDRIRLRLEVVQSGTWQANLFRLASLTWSVPVSEGFGRRLRFLVWDDNNGKLIGIFAIGDPVFNLGARDQHIDWTGHDRSERLVNVMDAYVLGAVPPYNMLLGGKLVACSVRSKEVYDAFAEKYGNGRGLISQQFKNPKLLAVTTSSSLGRSSLYNRLKLNGIRYFENIGYSGGWGHFHVPDDLFADLRAYLRETGHGYADGHSFGDGPNWRIRTIRAALDSLGFRGDMLRHGIKREIFISFFAANALDILRGDTVSPVLDSLKPVALIGAEAVDRWALPRSVRREEYRLWQSDEIGQLIKSQVHSAASLEAAVVACKRSPDMGSL